MPNMEPSGTHDPVFQPTMISPLAATIPDEERGAPVLLAHADRFWKAEEVNATRIATRANLVLSGVTAVLGLKLFAAGKEIETMTSPPLGLRAMVFWMLAPLCLALLLWCLGIILEVKPWWRTRKPSACQWLQIPDELAKTPWRMTRRQADWYIFRLTINAAEELHNRNRIRNIAVNRAQSLFFISAIGLFFSLGLYAWVARSQSRPSDVQGESNVNSSPTRPIGAPSNGRPSP